jgi:hypothetical protein
LLALFPSVIKMYETSHWFRDGNPSKYDNDFDWFSNERFLTKRHSQARKISWVARTIDEFYIFSNMICKAIHKYGSQLAGKTWITLSRHEPNIDDEMATGLERSTLVDLEPDELCIRILRVLRSASIPDKEQCLHLSSASSWTVLG